MKGVLELVFEENLLLSFGQLHSIQLEWPSHGKSVLEVSFKESLLCTFHCSIVFSNQINKK